MAFEQRHRLLSLVLHERSEPARRAPFATRAWLAGRAAAGGAGAVRATGGAALSAGQRGYETAKRWRDFPQDGAFPALRQRTSAPAASRDAGPGRREQQLRVRRELDSQVARVHEVVSRSRLPGTGDVDASTSARPTARSDAATLAARETRIASGLADARARGDHRRAASLQLRAGQVAEQIEARRAPAPRSQGGPLPQRLSRLAPQPLRERIEQRHLTRELDRAARAPTAQTRRSEPRAPSLALAGLTRSEYLRRAPLERRSVRLQIERELTRRRELLGAVAPTRRAALVASVPSRKRQRSTADIESDSSSVSRRERQFGPRQR
jgi:hypothetical protein